MASTSRAATDVDAHGVLYPRYVSIARTNERTNGGNDESFLCKSNVD